MSNVTIADIVNRHYRESPTAAPQVLIAHLVAREEAMAGMLRMAGMQFGMYPQIVAEILAEVQMGEPISADQRTMIRVQFNDLMTQIAAAQRGEGPMPQP